MPEERRDETSASTAEQEHLPDGEDDHADGAGGR